MEKTINIGGRLHNPAVGGAVTGANEIKDDTKGKMQNVINQETDAELVRLDEAKQEKLTFDQIPTEGSTNPVTSGGVHAADAALQHAIEAILLLIPSAASALNQLADKSFVNSSISMATATFRGTYNLVTDLELTVSATHQQIATTLASVVSTADNNDYCFVQIPVSDQSTDIRVTERYKFNGTSWSYEYDLNNSGFTADQWAAINSGITSVLVSKLGALPTAAELAVMFAGKQNTLTFDSTPVAGSDNPVKSSGLYNAFVVINAMIPEGADANNKLVAESRLVAYVTTLINALDATFDVTSADGHVTLRMTQADGVITSVQILTSDIASASALTTLAGRVSTAESDIDALQDAYAALTQSDVVIVEGALPSSGQLKNIIYRQPDQDHTPPQFYSDYMWNGTTWVLMATYMNAIDPRPKKGSQNLVTSGGVFDNMGALDVSELNATENPHTLAIYADLSAALASIPSDYQKGGMSIKFVQSSDNKYVQFRCMANTFTTDVTQWQGVDDEPTAGSDNLVKSGGVAISRIQDLMKYNGVLDKMRYDNTIPSFVFDDTAFLTPLIAIPSGVTSIDWNYGAVTNVKLIALDAQFMILDYFGQNYGFHREINLPTNTAYVRAAFDWDVHSDNFIWKVTDNDGNILWSEENLPLPGDFIKEQIATIQKIDGLKDVLYPYTDNAYLAADGSIHDNDEWLFTDYIPVSEGDNVLWHYTTKNIYIDLIIYDSNKALLDNYSASLETERQIEMPSGSAYIRATLAKSKESFVKVNDTAVWSLTGAHEIRISSLEDSVKSLHHTVGEDSINPDKYEDNVCLDTSANMQPKDGYLVTGYIPVAKDDIILWRYGNIDTNMCLCVYDATKTLIPNEYYRAAFQNERKITIIEGGAFIRASLPKGTDYWVKKNNKYAFRYSVFKNHEERISDLEKGIDGSPIILNVGTYNTGIFEGEGLVTPSAEGSLTYRKTIGGLNVNILGTQEDMLYYSSMTEGENVRDVIFPMFKNYYRFSTGQTNIKGFASDYDISNVQKVLYTGATFNHPWFLVGELTLKGKTILLASFHFDWADKNRRALQIQQIMSYANDYNYAILMGDTNVDNCIQPDIHDTPQRDKTHPFLYEEEFAIFKNAGYDLANGGNFGYFGTFLDKEVYPEGQWIPFDNIYVKGAVIRDAHPVTKDYMNDHKPVCATVII